VVQLPPEIPEGMDRPYFLMGDARSPVNLWRWRSDAGAPDQATGRGMNDVQAAGAAGLDGDAQWVDGEWQVVLRRNFEPTEEGQIRFESGRPIPVAFFAWDGDSGEDGTRGAISSWLFLHLEEETPPSTYVAPFIAFLLTGGLGLLAVRHARKREEEGHPMRGTPIPAAASEA
jgi:hypothetical protein